MTMPETLAQMTERSRAIFRTLVEQYLASGAPVGSRTLSRTFEAEKLSPATIRNVMQDLELMGLLDSPHTSAGRIPSPSGLRLFVDAVLQVDDLKKRERTAIEQAFTTQDAPDPLQQASRLLSGLSKNAGLVIAPKTQSRIKHIEFTALSQQNTLAILVMEDGSVENRLLTLPSGMPLVALTEASNYLNARICGMTLTEASCSIRKTMNKVRKELDERAASLIESGIAVWSEASGREKATLLVSGHANLLNDVSTAERVEEVRMLFERLERQEDMLQLLDLAGDGEGVRVFIGAESKLFSHSGTSLIISPYMNAEQTVIGALGVIGPTRLNYARVVPVVSYTARLLGRIIGGEQVLPGQEA